MPVFEYQMGIYVQAKDEDEAWERLQKRLMPVMVNLDYDDEPTIELVGSHPEGDFEQ